MTKFISFVSMGRNLIATLVGADQKNFDVVDVVKACDGARITHKAKISRDIAHEIIDTDYPGYIRRQPQLRTYWYWVHPQGVTKARTFNIRHSITGRLSAKLTR